MSKPSIFVSFDVDHDEDLRELFAGLAQGPDFPFVIDAWSAPKKTGAADWREAARQRIASVDAVVVICGELTHAAPGVSGELAMAQEQGKPYLLLWGRKGRLVGLRESP
jgi:hypothetical protein